MGFRGRFQVAVGASAVFAVALIAVALAAGPEPSDSPESPAERTVDQARTAVGTAEEETTPDNDLPTESAGPGSNVDRFLWVDPASAQQPWSALGAVEGLLTFRGNPTRSFYGRGPVPEDPAVRWRYDIGCSNSSVAGEDKVWCGTGWTGQPVVFRAPQTPVGQGDVADGAPWWVGFGGYNRAVQVLDAATGQLAMDPFVTGDIIKGTVTADPDGYPLLYSGSRDNFFHVIALDGDEPRGLWRLGTDGHGPTLWNNDWDGSALVVDDHLLVGGENSRFYVVKLNRGYDADGAVTVDPNVVYSGAGWDEQLLADIGDTQASIENSVALVGSVLFFANSAGLVQGWDLGPLASESDPVRVFRYWVGDDVDATLVADGEGGLYVAVEYERGTARAAELGQLIKLDVSEVVTGAEPDSRGAQVDPLRWSVELQVGLDSGVWATPAIWRDRVIVPTDDGRVVGLDRNTGATVWTIELTGPLWSSPVVVDDVLLQGDCAGQLNAFQLVDDYATPLAEPEPRWSVLLDGCIESTPAVWDGSIYVGTRRGTFFALADR